MLFRFLLRVMSAPQSSWAGGRPAALMILLLQTWNRYKVLGVGFRKSCLRADGVRRGREDDATVLRGAADGARGLRLQ